MTITVEVRAQGPLAALSQLVTALNDRLTANKAVAVMLTQWVDRNFRTSGSLIGGWAPIRDVTRKFKTKRKWSLQPLVTTGHALTLQRSFLPFYSIDTAGIGSEVPYSRYHQQGVPRTGGMIPGKRIPPRPMLPPRDQAIDMAIRVYGHFIGVARTRAGI